MSWAVVAEKDFRDAIHSRGLWLLSGLYVLLIGGAACIYATFDFLHDPNSPLSALGLVHYLQTPAAMFISITALLIGYKAIAGERERGSAKLLLSLPHSRRDVLIGKIFGRMGVLTVPLLLGFAVAAVIVLVLYDSFAVVDYAVFIVLTLLFAFVYICLAISLSAALKNPSRANIAAIGFWVFFNVLITPLYIGVLYVLKEFTSVGGRPPTWARFILEISPGKGYGGAMAAVLGNPTAAMTGGAEQVPFYLADWFGFVVLAFWIVVPLGVGYYRFQQSDL